MRTAFLFSCFVSLLPALPALPAGCAGAPKPAAANAQTTSASPNDERQGTVETANDDTATASSEKTAAEKWAEGKIEVNAKNAARTKTDFDPLAMNDELEAAAIPKIVMTDAKALRAKSRADLDASVALVRTESSVEGAAKKLVARLGKPTWTENGSKHVWVANAGAQCHRLVLDTDGSVEVETVAKGKWHMLAATASQNLCTGEIKRGIEK